MNRPQVINNIYKNQRDEKNQPLYMRSYPLTVILTIHLEPELDMLCNYKKETSTRNNILHKIKNQLNPLDQADHLFDYNFRVVINDKTHPAELTNLCSKLVKNIELKEKNKNNPLHKKRIILHFIALSKLYLYANMKKSKNSYQQLANNNSCTTGNIFDISATNRNGEISC